MRSMARAAAVAVKPSADVNANARMVVAVAMVKVALSAILISALPVSSLPSSCPPLTPSRNLVVIIGQGDTGSRAISYLLDKMGVFVVTGSHTCKARTQEVGEAW